MVDGLLKVDPKSIGDGNLGPGSDGKRAVLNANTPKAKKKAAKYGKANRSNQAKG